MSYQKVKEMFGEKQEIKISNGIIGRKRFDGTFLFIHVNEVCDEDRYAFLNIYPMYSYVGIYSEFMPLTERQERAVQALVRKICPIHAVVKNGTAWCVVNRPGIGPRVRSLLGTDVYHNWHKPTKSQVREALQRQTRDSVANNEYDCTEYEPA